MNDDSATAHLRKSTRSAAIAATVESRVCCACAGAVASAIQVTGSSDAIHGAVPIYCMTSVGDRDRYVLAHANALRREPGDPETLSYQDRDKAASAQHDSLVIIQHH